MKPHVKLMPPAQRKLRSELFDQVRGEIAVAFPEADTVCVYDILQGYQSDQCRKLILAVETRCPSEGEQPAFFESHVVKLGLRSEVAGDVDGWHSCTDGRSLSRRIFVPVRRLEIGGDDRVAVVYQNAAHWHGLLTPKDEVATLAWAVDRAVFHPGQSEPGVVERVIRQVLSELGRSFYHVATEDPQRAKAYYRSKLRLDRDQSAMRRWEQPEFRLLRRDVDWLLCGGISPASDTSPEYVDPYDFVIGLLQRGALPGTLVGPAHGDLHAANVVVGVSDGEVEYPQLIDYGDMSPDNVIAWDFVKLETEIKVRLLGELYSDPVLRESVFKQLRGDRFARLVDRWNGRKDAELDVLVDRTQQIAFAFEFERRLAEQTDQLLRSPRGIRPPNEPVGNAFDRAVSLLLAIRRQAANELGLRHQRSELWQRELNAALAIYGVSTIKFSEDVYPIYQRLFALVSAGLAAARLDRTLPSELQESDTAFDRPLTYHVPLRRAYRQWKANSELSEAETLLASFASQFDYAVPFVREHALLEAARGDVETARIRLEAIARSQGSDGQGDHSSVGISDLCKPFLEVEVLSRLGRIYKDKADNAWERLGVDFAELDNQAPVQFYRSAHAAYVKAYELSSSYYPGGNAAVTAHLCGRPEDARKVAQQVLMTCCSIELSELSSIKRFWVFATQGDMSLLLGRSADATNFFEAALGELSDGNDGIVQATYEQLCRLYAALGRETVAPALEAFEGLQQFALQPGPLGDCGDWIRTRDPSRRLAR